LNDLNDFEKKNNEGNESKTNISTENEESQISDISKLDEGKSQTSEIDIEQDDLDDSFEEDINKIDLIKFENDKLINEIRCKIKKKSQIIKIILNQIIIMITQFLKWLTH